MRRTKEQGFTLVEIAIVLIIIGLLLGGVLKGQAMIDNGRVKRIGSDHNGVTAAVNAYRDQYLAVPGDDPRAVARWASVTTNGNGTGLVDGAWDSTTNTDETRTIWAMLRNADLITGPTAGNTSFAQPANAFGGIIGVESNRYVNSGLEICQSSIAGAVATIVDTQFDDGNGTTGSIRVNSDAAATAGETTFDDPTNLCRDL
ncbi:MAG: prepilin-type N-terminal cleavage/methylation domain-containing protein [Magnetococcus sp. WYHC-3]